MTSNIILPVMASKTSRYDEDDSIEIHMTENTRSYNAGAGLLSPEAARWLAIISVILAGFIAALHVGKAVIALPQISEEFGQSLETSSWVMSTFPLIGVIGGVMAGAFVQRWGDRRLLSFGLFVIAIASLAGAFTETFFWLICTRFAEGFGFLLTVVAAPVILNRLARSNDRSIIFGAWSTFMPGGMAISLVFGPILGEWRYLWLVGAGLAGFAVVLLLLTVPALVLPEKAWHFDTLSKSVRVTLQAKSTWILALVFATYSLQFLAVSSFLPIFLMQRAGITVAAAGMISAAVVASNIIGNVLAGPLLARGAKPSILIVWCSIGMGLTGATVFLPLTPPSVAILSAFIFSAIGGLLPTTILDCAPRAVPDPAHIPLCIGLVMQGNYLGQALGPVIVGTVVAGAGWSAAAIPVVIVAMLGVVLGLFFKTNEREINHAG